VESISEVALISEILSGERLAVFFALICCAGGDFCVSSNGYIVIPGYAFDEYFENDPDEVNNTPKSPPAQQIKAKKTANLSPDKISEIRATSEMLSTFTEFDQVGHTS
jgi:hypothetical protein